MGFDKNDLTNCFDSCRQMVTGETLEQVRVNYYIGALMSESDDKAIGGLNINTSGRTNHIQTEKKDAKRSIQDIAFMNMMNEMSLPDMEEMLAGKYGEDFAENLAAEYLDPEVYKELMKIKDPDERRKAIAEAINEAIANGTIDPTDIYANPDFEAWLEKHRLEDNQDIALDSEINMSQTEIASSSNNTFTTSNTGQNEEHNLSGFGCPIIS